ncbi:MAG: two-component regulator propeller domain-containing protein [Candidatus Zixiibacteriota bacterium]
MKLEKIIVLAIIILTLGSAKPAAAGWMSYDVDNNDLISNYINALYADTSGSVWIGSNGNGAEKFDGINHTVYMAPQELVSNIITDITSDSSGSLWFSSFYGFCSYDGLITWTQYVQGVGLEHVDIKTMVVDDSGFMWLGTFGAGVIKYNGDTTVAHYTTDSGLADNNTLSSLIDADGNIWFGTRGGVSRLDHNGNWTSFTRDNSGLRGDLVFAMVQDPSGYFWLGTDSGLNRFDGVSDWTTFTEADGLAPGAVTAVAVDSLGYIWAGHAWTNAFDVWLSVFDGAVWVTYDRYNGVGSNADVTDITVDTAGMVWISTFGDGLTSFEHESSDAPDDNRSSLPASFNLLQNFPNPFNASTKISYALSRRAHVTISIYNVLGRNIMELVDAVIEPGEHAVIWDGNDFSGNPASSGIYFYEIRSDDFRQTRKMVLMK